MISNFKLSYAIQCEDGKFLPKNKISSRWTHDIHTSNSYTYASAVFKETVHIALIIALLNAFKVMAADVMNAYITASYEEKIWTLLGFKFSKDKGCNTLYSGS